VEAAVDRSADGGSVSREALRGSSGEASALFLPFAANANTRLAADCIHPSGAGYQAIAALSGAAFLNAQ